MSPKFIAGCTLLLTPMPALAEPIPEAIARMIDTALASNDAATIAAVVAVAKRTAPNSAGEIDAMAADFNAMRAARQADEIRAAQMRLADASPLSLWKGEIELGGSRSTGNTKQLALYGATNLKREGINWRHSLTGRGDLQETNGRTNTERALLAYQPNYKFGPQLYAAGLLQYEHDRFLGFAHRYTAGLGVGYSVVKRPGLSIDLEGGPALRYTAYYDEPNETTVAGRGSLAMRWAVTPTLNFAQDAAFYVEEGNSNAVSTTSIDTRLIGALKARFSYNVRYERNAPIGRDEVDTITRASLVYGF